MLCIKKKHLVRGIFMLTRRMVAWRRASRVMLILNPQASKMRKQK